ncbi:glycosyltransferase family 1 protein [Microbacterium profundi]|uniref:Glycosyltransferase family 1 protein n=1 Tax=Microbacterium profundi TaxID=450380 RepID=A0ABV3LLA9_9MICO
MNSESMRVLFDAFWWHRGPTANRSVMREIIFAWKRVFPDDEIVLAIRSAHADLAADDVPENARVVTTRGFPHALSNSLELAQISKRVQADVMIVHNYTPLTGDSVVFIHDLMFEDHPEWFSPKERLYFAPMGWLARRAAGVTTSSAAESARIERLHPRLAPVSSIGLSIPSAMATATPTRPDGLGSIDRFFLCVGRMNVRKNLETAIDGARLSTSISAEFPLVIVGSSEHSGVNAELPPSVRRMAERGELLFLGKISDGELRWLYERSAGLLFLSRDEGFGLPPVEAGYFGSPVVASDIDVLREVTGGEAIYVDPDSSADVAQAIDSLALTYMPRLRRTSTTRDAQAEWDSVAIALRHATMPVPKEDQS